MVTPIMRYKAGGPTRTTWKVLSLILALVSGVSVHGQQSSDAAETQQGITPDLRNEDMPLTAKKGNFLAVPIPFSNPTLDSGLVLVGGYFHAQTEKQKATQPASATGVMYMKSSNGSYAYGVGNASYWNEDRWRFKGFLGYADLSLPLLVGDPGSTGLSVDWLLQGKLGYAALSRKLGGRWYLGLVGRYVDVDQQIDANLQSRSLPGKNTILSAAAGLSLTYDSRDMPGNPYRGRLFTASALFTSKALGSDDDYQGYALDYRSYHSLAKPFVLAWTAQYCSRAGDVPLWDACRLNLRGSAATDYMGLSSVVAKVEGRWRLSERWGLVAFTGAGQLTESFTGGDDYDIVTNYGAGIRFMVQKSNRVNLRLDYGRVDNDAAIMLSVGEAF